jgi:hypothetical protein
MNSSFELDYQTTLGTAEVDDERPDRMLPAKLQPFQAPSAQFFPQKVFNQGLARAQISRCGDIVAMLAMAGTHFFSFACAMVPFGMVEKPPLLSSAGRVPAKRVAV